MLKSITVTRHETVETWNNWLVGVPDDMNDECIVEMMQELVNNYDLDLDQEEGAVDDELTVDIADAPSNATTPDLMLTEDGLIDEGSVLSAFATERLHQELRRREAKEGDIIVV
jgi:hypothetical protein